VTAGIVVAAVTGEAVLDGREETAGNGAADMSTGYAASVHPTRRTSRRVYQGPRSGLQ
jgi:hypothetical protein